MALHDKITYDLAGDLSALFADGTVIVWRKPMSRHHTTVPTIKEKANSRKHRTTPEEQAIDKINREILENGDYDDIEDLDQQLERYKAKFLAFQKDAEGNIDLVGLKKMLEECGQPKTHLELKKMIRQVDKTNTGTICYRDFVTMMCGPANSVLKIILRFEQREADKDKLPVGPPPKRDLASLP